MLSHIQIHVHVFNFVKWSSFSKQLYICIFPSTWMFVVFKFLYIYGAVWYS